MRKAPAQKPPINTKSCCRQLAESRRTARYTKRRRRSLVVPWSAQEWFPDRARNRPSTGASDGATRVGDARWSEGPPPKRQTRRRTLGHGGPRLRTVGGTARRRSQVVG